jgi:hypothetical protein
MRHIRKKFVLHPLAGFSVQVSPFRQKASQGKQVLMVLQIVGATLVANRTVLGFQDRQQASSYKSRQ